MEFILQSNFEFPEMEKAEKSRKQGKKQVPNEIKNSFQ